MTTPYMRRMSFRVVVDNTSPHDDLAAARGIAVGLLLAVPAWCALAGIAWWAWATGVGR